MERRMMKKPSAAPIKPKAANYGLSPGDVTLKWHKAASGDQKSIERRQSATPRR
jgi:hypothetical protein